MEPIAIGPSNLLLQAPVQVEIGGKPYILSRQPDGAPMLLSAICPHQNGIVEPASPSLLRCPNHGWTFDPANGKCLNAPKAILPAYSVHESEGTLYATLDQPRAPIPLTPASSAVDETFRITLVSHACVLIEWKGIRILTDPWIDGPAFFGSWTSYPPSTMRARDLPALDYLWISHEHPDHFHEPTLARIPKHTPVLVPDFDDGRLVKRLQSIGFTNVRGLPSGQNVLLKEGIEVISFKSASVWNDSMLYLNLGGFSILNVNDAGINWRIADIIPHVDLVCSAFSQGASGYPLTWTHLSEKEKQDLIANGNIGMMKMLEQLVKLFTPTYLMPIASFSELCYPGHRAYAIARKKNTPHMVAEHFAGKPVKVLDLIPGEWWDAKLGVIHRRPQREQFYDATYLYAYLDKAFASTRFADFHPTAFDITHDHLRQYFMAFSGSTLAKEVGPTTISFSAQENDRALHAKITFMDGMVAYQPIDEPDTQCNLVMQCPGGLVQELIKQDLSWDDIHIGYWCTFSRNPDTYNIALWKLLHAPWQARTRVYGDAPATSSSISGKTPIAEIVEKRGTKAINVLERHGLYCAGCVASLGESIAEGCRVHGLSMEETQQLIEELSQL